MPGGFIRREPSDPSKLHEHPEVVDLFTPANWMSFFCKIWGHDEEITEEFLMSLRPQSKTQATVIFRGLTLELTTELISRVTGLPLGLPWSKEERLLGQATKKTFFLLEEHPVEDKNGVRRTSLPPLWSELSFQIMKYITCEGRFSIVFGYHFRLLCELRHGIDSPPTQKLSIPYFLLQSLIECGTKLNERIPDQLAHHGLIKLLVEDALHTYTIPISWEIFRNMSRDGDIRVLAKEITSSSSEEGEHTEEGKKTSGEGTHNIQAQQGQKEKGEKGQIVEPKTEEETKAQTPREKRMQRRQKNPKWKLSQPKQTHKNRKEKHILKWLQYRQK